MAEILALKAWRYNPELFPDIENQCSPLFDVVSEKHRRNLYHNLYNSIHLSVPQDSVSNKDTAALLQEWKKNRILLQDPKPAIYVYYQYFSFPGSEKVFCRKGFIANIKAYEWSENIMLRHENTIPHSVEDRLDLLQETQLNVSPTHGLYTDSAFQLEPIMDKSMEFPVYDAENYQGVRDVMSIIDNPDWISRFIAVLKDKQVILADGHHRYEASRLYRRQQMKEDKNHTGTEGYNYHLMHFTNTEADDLRILPTHRLISGIENFNKKSFLQKLEQWFTIQELDNPFDINTIILGKKWAFGLMLKDQTFFIRLKEEAFVELNWKMPVEVKQLDLTILHFFIIEKALSIKGKEQRSSKNIDFERNFAVCLARVLKEEAQLAIIIKDISMEDIKKVCYSGYTMPQKSTYFYPKVICGYLFSSLLENEFKIPPYTSV